MPMTRPQPRGSTACTRENPPARRPLAAICSVLLLVLAVCFLYGETGGFEFLRLDDHDYTFRCRFVFDGFSWKNLAEAFANVRHAAIWMPLTYLSYMADISAFGAGAGPHHLVNVAIHAANAVLLFGLLVRLFPRRTGLALAAALFWAIHPQRAEAVAWIAGRKELLCAFFTLAGLLAWARGGRAGRVLGVAGCLCACMSKPTAMCFPFLAFAVEVLRRGTVDTRKSNVLAYGLLLLLACATGALAVYSQTHAEGYDVRALFSASFPWRMLNAAVAVGLYLFQLVLPVGIHLDYRATPGEFPLQGVLGLSSLLLAVVAGIAIGRRLPRARRKVAVCALVWFAASLGPTLGVFGSFGEQARADRFFYLPAMAVSLGLVPLLGALKDRWAAARPRAWRFAAGAGAVALLVCAGASFPVVAAYRNDYTAFSRTLGFDPAHGRALAHVASEECARHGRIDRGISLYRASQKLRPRDDTAAQLAYALMMRGHSADHAEIRQLCAKFACNHALDVKGMALEALGTTAMRQRKWQEAARCLEDSIRAPRRFYSPEDAQLRLGACYCNLKRVDDAIRIFEPLTRSKRADVSARARQALATLRQNPRALLFF
ncbi:MAG: hypothetical protein ACI4Q3_09355 [Kiritimatiellia bacterium]